MNFIGMPQKFNYQTVENSKQKKIENTETLEKFDKLIKENCRKKVYKIISKDDFVRQSLLEIKNHDMNTFFHSLEVGNMTAYLINQLGDKLEEEEKRILITSSLLHDYGKTSIDFDILNKEDDLTDEEWEKIKNHVRAGFENLKTWDMEVAKVVAGHHEHQEQSYPREKVLDDVMEKRGYVERSRKLSRILAIIDTFQAMSDHTRPSNKKNPKGIREIVDELYDKKFILNKDKEIIFILEDYYYKNKNQNEVDSNYADKNFS